MRDPLSRIPIKYKLPAAFVGICLVAFGVGGYLIDPETYGLANQARLNFLGLPRENIEGHKIWDINIREDDWRRCVESNREAFMGRKVTQEEWVMNAHGKLTCQLVTKTPLLDDNGHVMLVYMNKVDFLPDDLVT